MIRVPIQVRYNDYDDRGHVNNAVYLTYFELGRVEAWRLLGHAREPGFIIAEARVSYRSPATLGVPLALELLAGEVRTKAWVWKYRVVDERDGRLVAEGETTQVLFDYDAGRTAEIPPPLRAALEAL